MLFKMHKDNVLLVLDPPQRKSTGGLYLPDLDRNSEYGAKMLCATVVDVGPGGVGTKNETEVRAQFDMEVSEGDRVLVNWDCGEQITVGEDIRNETAPDHTTGTEFRVVRCSEIAAVVG